MTLPSPKICRRIRQLHAMLGSPNPNEAASAREKLLKLLANNDLSWHDVPAVVAAADADDALKPAPAQAAPQRAAGPEINVLDLVLRLLERYVSIKPEERMAVALWILHTHVFDKFVVTPRLALLSPVRGCGKTTLLALLEMLVANPDRSDDTTAAAIYHSLAYGAQTLLVDEGDNLGLFSNRNKLLRTLFNSGHRRGTTIKRVVSGRSRRFPTFAPQAIAAIGMLPLPLLHRAVIINMQRAASRLERFEENDPALIASFMASREQIRLWAATCTLERDPEMPTSLRINRAADNWRVLLAIADDLGHGEEARAAAIALCSDRPDEDPGVVLLADVHTVFQMRGIDRIPSAALVEALLGLDDGLWTDWRGPNDDRPPRKLNQADLARLLRPFGITPRTIWPAQRQPGSRSSRGYLRSQFEPAWQAYCPSADTSTHTNKIIQLPGT